MYLENNIELELAIVAIQKCINLLQEDLDQKYLGMDDNQTTL